MSDDRRLIFAEWDGLDPAEKDALDERVAADPELTRAREQARLLRADLRALGPHGSDEIPIPKLDFAGLAKVTPLPVRRRTPWLVAAAATVLVAAGGWWAWSASGPDASGPAQPIALAPTPADEAPPAPEASPEAVDEDIAVAFRLRAPDARLVTVAGDFNDWKPETLEMHRTDDGLWTARTALPPGRYAYMYVVDGQWITPPDARRTQDDGFGARNGVLDLLEPSDA